jgi:hypothetical protein
VTLTAPTVISGCSVLVQPVPALPHGMGWALLVLLLGSVAYLLSRRTSTEASR